MESMDSPDPLHLRIITTLGHVDHGKTTLMDTLLAANNIVSAKMAGKLRYMDGRKDEQERGITMESSAVALAFRILHQGVPTRYVINVIDTPGHVDFSSEVSTASRLCDGALVLVDVVEGVCTQTIAVLRQAWHDRLRPILVINKIDRLITELQLKPSEAYSRLLRLIEQVNAVLGDLYAGDRMGDDLRRREERERCTAAKQVVVSENLACFTDDFQEKDDEGLYFSPNRGNVIFSSAIDGWGFRIGKFAQLYAAKLGIKEVNLRRVLWGDYFLDPKTKKVITHKQLNGRPLKPLFVQFILENIWAVYEAVVITPTPEKVSRIVTALGLKFADRELKSKDTRSLLSSVFSQWLSLSACIVQAVIDVVPPPSIAQPLRMPRLLHPDLPESNTKAKNGLEEDLYSCMAGPDRRILAFVSKMFAVPERQLVRKGSSSVGRSRPKAKVEATEMASNLYATEETVSSDDTEVFLGFARLYSGTIRTGVRVHCVLPKYQNILDADHPHNSRHVAVAVVQGLYVMMGRELISVDCVRAGNIFAVRGLEGVVWRSATICAPDGSGVSDDRPGISTNHLVNLGSVYRTAPPIVRVALEPAKSVDMPKFVNGLRMLIQSDPCAETFQQPTGEHVIVTAGELHLERCMKDLRERFAKVDVRASEPIVPFRETAVNGADMPATKTPHAARGTIRGASSQNPVKFTIRVSPIPENILNFILENLAIIRNLERATGEPDVVEDDAYGPQDDPATQGEFIQRPTVAPECFWAELQYKCEAVGGEWSSIVDRIIAFGPQKAGGCMLVDSRKTSPSHSLRHRLMQTKSHKGDKHCNKEERKLSYDLHNYVETGFQLATSQGPLCAEPVRGLAYFVEALEIDSEVLSNEVAQNQIVQATGYIISAVRDACSAGMLDWSPRLMLAVYTCYMQATADVMGKVYGVVAKHRGRIMSEEMNEGSAHFNVCALLPIIESFGFVDDIHKKTSGTVTPQLVFSGYELLDEDPFWAPTTEDKLEDLGEKTGGLNRAKTYMEGVRERKGLFVDRKLVENAEKQRTLKK